jgi:tight adherence protein C
LPRANLAQIRIELVMAGSPWGLSPLDFLALRLVGSVAVGALGVFTGISSGWPLLQLAGAGAMCAFVGSQAPKYLVKSRIRSRQHDISRALPDALDMLTICVDAGLAFDLAMLKIAEKWDNTVAGEFNRVVAEIRMGLSREDALRRLVERTGVAEIGNFVAVLIQADQLGVSIADVLHVQSDQMRERRHQRAEELANQAPVKMVFPLVFLILPALFIMILGPAIPRMAEALSAMGGG